MGTVKRSIYPITLCFAGSVMSMIMKFSSAEAARRLMLLAGKSYAAQW